MVRQGPWKAIGALRTLESIPESVLVSEPLGFGYREEVLIYAIGAPRILESRPVDCGGSVEGVGLHIGRRCTKDPGNSMRVSLGLRDIRGSVEGEGPHIGRWCAQDPGTKTRVSPSLIDSGGLVEGEGPQVGRWCVKDPG
ncbi:hypothetical protein QTO34_000593 [Cnephaeus nilssonii]|uniref:Uncharacterized protein n=1 Tax=Cnephaeus nilssonii TaxID=3371016 RepID=A0AA40IBV5_CNENI|nr:hypothetical protein QTO34_000593 [Eptesicus nilssonii]